MVLVQDAPRLVDAHLVGALDVPGQPAERVQVGADHARFGALGVHALQAAEFLDGLFLHFGRHVRRGDLLAVLVLFLRLGIGLAQLALDSLHLLAQEVLALALAHFLLHLVLDLAAHVQKLDLAHQDLVDPRQALQRVDRFQDLLALVIADEDVGGHQVGQLARLLDVVRRHQYVGAEAFRDADVLLELLVDRAHHRLQLKRVHEFLGQGLDRGLEVRRVGEPLFDAITAEALDQDPRAALGDFQHAQDQPDRADVVEIPRRRVIEVFITLGQKPDDAAAGKDCLNRGNRFIPG